MMPVELGGTLPGLRRAQAFGLRIARTVLRAWPVSRAIWRTE